MNENGATKDNPARMVAAQGPPAEEIVTIPNCQAKVATLQDGSIVLTFILPSRSRAYQFPIDPDGRESLGKVLLGPSVKTYGPADVPRAT